MLTSVLHLCRTRRVPRHRAYTVLPILRACLTRARTLLGAFRAALLARPRASAGGGADDNLLDEMAVW